MAGSPRIGALGSGFAAAAVWVLSLILGLGAHLAVTPAVVAQEVPVSPQERRVAQIQGEKRAAVWTKMLQEAEAALKAGKGKNTEKISRLLARDMMDDILFGESAGQWLGTACLMRALGAAQQGKVEEAIWYWHVAQNLYPTVSGYDLSPYGRAGEILMMNPLRPASFGELPRTDDEASVGITPPNATFAPFAVYPYATTDLQAELRIPVECRVDRDGRLSHPLVASGDWGPTFAYAVLDGLRAWKLEPAQRDSEPVAVLHRLVVTFEVR